MDRVELFATIDAPEVACDPAPDRIVDGAPRAFATTLYDSDDQRVSVGTWRCTPGRWRVAYDETEYCRILAGSGLLIDDLGPVLAFAGGDEFVVPAGFRGQWVVLETMTKRYVAIL